MKKTRFAIIGAGNMGAAIAAGLPAERFDVTLSNRSQAKLDAFKATHPYVTVTPSNLEAASDADFVIIATRPAQTMGVIQQITSCLKPGALLVTLAPQLGLAQIAEKVSCHAARMMPNTAIEIGKSMTFICYDPETPAAVRDEFKAAMEQMGAVGVIDESLMGAATALCSCGLAYALRYVRAAVEGAVALGFSPDDATSYVSSTLQGAVTMLATGRHPEDLIDSVTTPGGTTIRGLIAMEKAGFSNAVIQGLLASSKHE